MKTASFVVNSYIYHENSWKICFPFFLLPKRAVTGYKFLAFSFDTVDSLIPFNSFPKAGLLEPNGGEECCSAVTDLCTFPDGTFVAVAVQK